MGDLVISLIIALIIVLGIKAALFYNRKKQSDEGEAEESAGKFTMEIYVLLTAIVYMILNSSTLQ